MTDWLKKRLPPVKAKTPMWVELTESVQDFWDTYHEPLIDSVERARSVFTADEWDVDKRLEERGVKFEVALPFAIGSKAVYYSMRAYELHSKDNESLLSSILGRDFGGFSIKWLPLFAPKNEPYGSKFITEFDIPWFNYSSSDLWATSRGKVLYDITNALSIGMSRLEMKEAILRKVYELKPVHIVFDGIYFVSYFVLEVEPCRLLQADNSYSTNQISLDFFPAAYFDSTQLDDYRLDSQPVHGSSNSFSTASVSLLRLKFSQWRLDMGWLIDGVYRAVSGIEGDVLSTLHVLGVNSKAVNQVNIEQCVIGQARLSYIVYPPASLDMFLVPHFDDTKLDVCLLDTSMASCRHTAKSMVTADFWPLRKWSLDTGFIINGTLRTISGVEDDYVSRLSMLGCDKFSIYQDFEDAPITWPDVVFFDNIPADFLPLDVGFNNG